MKIKVSLANTRTNTAPAPHCVISARKKFSTVARSSKRRNLPPLETTADIPDNMHEGDDYMRYILYTALQRRFTSEYLNGISANALKIMHILEDAGWSKDNDWPFFAEILIDIMKTEGAKAAYDYTRDYLKQTMAAASAIYTPPNKGGRGRQITKRVKALEYLSRE